MYFNPLMRYLGYLPVAKPVHYSILRELMLVAEPSRKNDIFLSFELDKVCTQHSPSKSSDFLNDDV